MSHTTAKYNIERALQRLEAIADRLYYVGSDRVADDVWYCVNETRDQLNVMDSEYNDLLNNAVKGAQETSGLLLAAALSGVRLSQESE